MKVLFDHQVFSSQVYGGISRYFCELMWGFAAAGRPDYEVSVRYTKNAYVRDLSRKNIPCLATYGLGRLLFRRSAINQRCSEHTLAARGFDVFHPTYYDPYFLSHLRGKPFVLTVHDLIHEVFRDSGAWEDGVRENKRVLIGRAAQVITVSESTRSDLLRFYSVAPDKVSVTPLASSFHRLPPQRPEQTIPERYLLFVGQRRRHKNFLFLIEAIHPLMRQDASLHLVCTGDRPFRRNELDLMARLAVLQRAHHLHVCDAQLAWLYRHALALVFPTLYEGFGLPVLEAFACDCPAVISRTSSLPEVGGDAATYFDPENGSSIRDAISSVIYDSQQRQTIVQRGQRQLERFSWDRTVRQTQAIYESVLL